MKTNRHFLLAISATLALAADVHAGRWLSRDPIEEGAGFVQRDPMPELKFLPPKRNDPNLYAFTRNNPINSIDLFGLLVTVVLDTKANTLTITDDDTGKSVTVQAFTGGHVNPDCSILSPGTGKEASAPAGGYWLVDNPNPTVGHEDWYGLFKQDGRIDDYFDDNGKERSGVRLHLGGVSWGCVTVSKCQPDAAKKWKEIIDLISNTKKEKIKFIKGPHWWNPEGETTKYGTVTIK